jgi:hypothetical protein
MLFEFLRWLEESFLGHLMRDTGLWTYAFVNLLHIVGIAILFGSILILDLRLLGLWPRVPLDALSVPVVPLAGIGFAVAVTTGVLLLATKATEYFGNPFLYIKIPVIALGGLNILLTHHSAAWKAHRIRDLSAGEISSLARMGGISLACWLTVLVAGRMIAYW